MTSLARVLVSLSLSLSAVPFIACSSDEASKPAPASSGGAYRGLLTGPTETGVLDVTIGGESVKTSGLRTLAATSSVGGTIAIAGGGGTVSLTGTYDAATGTLTLTGTNAKGTYALTGTSSSSGFSGKYSGPNGSSGVFSLTSAANGATAELYCGTYSTLAGQVVGVWNLVIGSGVGTGAHCDPKGCGALTATVSGTTLTITDADKPTKPPTTGTITGGTASGTIPGDNGGGTFTGSTSACSAPPPATLDGGLNPVDGGSDADATVNVDASDGAVPVVVETLTTGVNDPVGLSIDATHVYWLSGGDGAIRRCALGGCGAGPENVVASASVSSSVAVDNAKIYWTNGFRYLSTCSVGSGGSCTSAPFADMGANSYPAHLWVAAGHLYWIAESATVRMIQTCPLAGCTSGYPKTIYSSTSGSLIHGTPLAGLAVNGTDAYLTSYTGGVFRFPMTDAETVTAGTGTQVQPSAYTTSGLELDGTTMRWSILNDGKVVQCTTPSCTTVTDFVTGQLAPGTTRGNATHVYGFNRGTAKGTGTYNASTGSVWRIAK